MTFGAGDSHLFLKKGGRRGAAFSRRKNSFASSSVSSARFPVEDFAQEMFLDPNQGQEKFDIGSAFFFLFEGERKRRGSDVIWPIRVKREKERRRKSDGYLGKSGVFWKGKGKGGYEGVSALLSQIGARKYFPGVYFLLWSLDQSYVSYGLCCYQEIVKKLLFSLVFIFLANFLWREK